MVTNSNWIFFFLLQTIILLLYDVFNNTIIGRSQKLDYIQFKQRESEIHEFAAMAALVLNVCSTGDASVLWVCLCTHEAAH